jgi:BirA family biotin operon repressor/biotin-[acetyl-CoA-carboxylase] ligase
VAETTTGDNLSPEAITAGLGTLLIGRQVLVYQTVPSTNRMVAEMAAQNAEEGLVVLAEEQTAGMGRRQRRWFAPPGTSILLSVLLRPEIPASDGFLVTMMASVATLNAIEAETGLVGALKWPNDVLIRGRKTAGVLVECQIQSATVVSAVVGIGINVNFDPAQIPEIPPGATSLKVELGHPLPRAPLVRALLRRLDELYQLLKAGQGVLIFQIWRERLSTVGQRVKVLLPQETLTGLAEEITPEGGLVLRLDDGTRRVVHAGEVAAY